MVDTQPIDNNEDIIDSRDVIARIAALDPLHDKCSTDDCPDEMEHAEFDALTALAEEASDAASWSGGAALIADSYFEEYAEELACDIGAIDGNASWPLNHIDWAAAAEELQRGDYLSVDFDGVTYWIRA